MKRAYTAPRFETFGDLRSVTLGGSTPGTGDSGNPTIKKQPMMMG